jgi:hypothetical protein
VASQVYEDTYQAPYTEDAINEDSEEDVIEDVYVPLGRRHNHRELCFRDTW